MRPAAQYTIAFALSLAVACGGDDLLLPGDGAATRIAIAGGDGQSGAVGATLADSISVLVSDATGRPVMGQPVAFVVTAGDGGVVSPDTALTGADGRAGARWVLGRDAGTQSAQAELVTREGEAPSVVFSASATPGSAAVLALVSGDRQTAPAGTALPDSLVVRVEDQFGNPVAGASVTWTVSGGGFVSSTRVTTPANGRAAVRRTLGLKPGEQGAAASVSGLDGSPMAFTHTATSTGGGGGDDDRIVRLSFLVQPSDAGKDERISPAVQVAAVNASGAPVSSAPGEVEVRLEQNPENAQLRGDRTRPLEGGAATFDDLKGDARGGGLHAHRERRNAAGG